jgi:hypothetical protein
VTIGFWTWAGWPALVAVGTLALALATGALAGFTYLVTRDSRDELRLESRRLEVSQRPIVLPGELEPAPEAFGDPKLSLSFMNAGPGAALNIEAQLRWGKPAGVVLTFPQFHGPGGFLPHRFRSAANQRLAAR